jgi:hypothetical protein
MDFGYRQQPPLSRSGLITGFYGALALAGLLVSAGREDVDIYRIEGVSTAARLGLSPFVGLAVGLAVVALSRWTVRRFAWAQALHRDFRHLIGPLSRREILILALASSIGEEMLFRGALQPWIGLWPQAALFALLHIGPGLRLLPWTISAFVLGVSFGYMLQWLGDLGSPIAAHFIINYLNLHFIVRTNPAQLRSPA